jgi:ribose transport system substrate-binding protein
MRSRPGISSTDERYQGFVDRLKGTGLRVASTLSPSCDDSAAARSATADMLSANPDLGGLFSVCDVIALGAARALQGAGKLDVQHVSIDASKDGVGLIVSNGGIDAEVAQHLRRAGRESVLVLARALQGQQVDKRIDTGTELVTKENAQAYLRRAAQDSK